VPVWRGATSALSRGCNRRQNKASPEPLSENIAFAASWLRKAADQNYPPAQYALATLYENNENDDGLILADPTKAFTRDVVEADRWFTICWKQSSGDVPARCGEGLSAIERQMTGDQIFEAQSRAIEWMRSHF
jgi:TPR repeat protein